MTSQFFQTQLDSFALRKSLMHKPKKEVDVFADSAGLQNEYEDLTAGHTLDEDIEHVKGLDIWNVPLTTHSKSCAPSFTNLKSTKDYRQKKAQEGGFPHVKTELLNRILAHREDEGLVPMGGSSDPFDNEDGGLPIIRKDGDGTLKKYEATKLAHNEELIHELVLRRMREQINVETISRMGQTQLKLYIKSIAEDAVAHFKSLKGMLSPKLIQNYVHAALEMVRENKSGMSAPKATKENSWAIEERPVTNYEANEMILVKDYEFNMKQAKELRVLVADLGHQIFNAKKEKAYFDDKLNMVRNEYREIIKGADPGSASGRYTQRRIAVAQPGMVKDHMQTKKMKDEKKNEENYIVKALAELEDRQKRLNAELKQTEYELKVAKSIKTSCQIQLKKLYYDILKDEEALMRGTENNKSYAWVLRALWNLGEDVKEDAYPLFLDSKAHEYLVAIAKCQEELEIHCRHHNLNNMLNNLKGFKPLNSVLQHRSDRNQPFSPNLEDTTVDAGGSRFDLDDHRAMAKSLNMLMEEFRERAFEMKKVNLKVRKPAVQPKSYSKDKNNNAPKWEEVDPKDLAALGLDYPGLSKKPTMGGRNASLPKLVPVTSKPLEKAMDILHQLDELRKDAIEKLTRTYMAKVLDERTKLDLHKTFRFVFGREEGDHYFSKLVTEKKFVEEKMGASIRKIKTKTTSNDFLSPLRISKSPTEMRSASTMGLRKGLLDLPSSTKYSRGFAFL